MLVLLLLLLSALRTATAAFLSPFSEPNQSLSVGASVAIIWTATWDLANVSVPLPKEFDLWVTSYNNDAQYADRILQNVTITADGTLSWDIRVPPAVAHYMRNFVLLFKPHQDNASFVEEEPVFTSEPFELGTEPDTPAPSVSGLFSATSASLNSSPAMVSTTSPIATLSSSTSTSTPSNPSSPASSGKSRGKAGVIAGSVVGGVTGVAVICGVVLIILRRLKRKKRVEAGETITGTDDKQGLSGPALTSKNGRKDIALSELA